MANSSDQIPKLNCKIQKRYLFLRHEIIFSLCTLTEIKIGKNLIFGFQVISRQICNIRSVLYSHPTTRYYEKNQQHEMRITYNRAFSNNFPIFPWKKVKINTLHKRNN